MFGLRSVLDKYNGWNTEYHRKSVCQKYSFSLPIEYWVLVVDLI